VDPRRDQRPGKTVTSSSVDRKDDSMAETDRIEALATRIAAFMPDLDPPLQRAALTLLGLLAQGKPVEVQRLSEALAMPATYLDETLERSPGVFRDDHGRIVGFIGLSVAQISDHRLHIDERSLWAWCAWDTLFLPELLGETVRVSSRCPSTGTPISLTVTPDGPTDLVPREAVVSFVVPQQQFDANVLKSFCHFVHFFASPDTAASWTAEHPGTFPLSVDDAYRLGQLTNRAAFGAALDASSDV
jgi:alkylmercury lyase